jgi:hypothetical protein
MRAFLGGSFFGRKEWELFAWRNGELLRKNGDVL